MTNKQNGPSSLAEISYICGTFWNSTFEAVPHQSPRFPGSRSRYGKKQASTVIRCCSVWWYRCSVRIQKSVVSSIFELISFFGRLKWRHVEIDVSNFQSIQVEIGLPQ
jgi:hypothetical protein